MIRASHSGKRRTFLRAHAHRAQYFAARAVRRLLQRPGTDLRAVASERIVLSPAERQEVVPPRLPAGHLERAIEGWGGEPAQTVVERLKRSEILHEATEALVLDDATLLGAHLFAGACREDLLRGEPPGPHDVVELDEVVMASTWSGARWFGHFVHDELPLQLLAPELGRAVATDRPTYRDEPSLRRLFGVPAPEIVRGFRARRCTVLIDHAQNASKRARYQRMHGHVQRSPGPPLRVYLQRTAGDPRELLGEASLLERLVRSGFTVIRAGEVPVDSLIALCSRAEQIVSVDGSHLAPALFAAPRNAELINLLPPARMTTVATDIARAAGLAAAVFIGSPGPDRDTFAVDADELLRFIDGFRPPPTPRG